MPRLILDIDQVVALLGGARRLNPAAPDPSRRTGTGPTVTGMAEFEHQDLQGSTFSDVTLRGSRFETVDLRDCRMRNVYLADSVLRGAVLDGVDIDGEIGSLTINGVEVGPYVEAELDRRDPDRAKMRAEDADGFREAWSISEHRWAGTVERARGFAPEQLHERVADEWSFIETLRHLLYATESWIHRVLLGDPRPWHPLSLPFDEMDPHPDVPWDRDARPSLDEVLALREDRMATVRRVLHELTDDRLAGTTEPVDGPSHPPANAYPVRRVLLTVLNEEWLHRTYAERDLDVLAGG